MTTNTLAKLAPSSVLAFSEALHGAKGELDAWLECNNEAEVKAHIFSLTAQALPAAGRCDECGKDQAEGWALYCVDCLEKTGLLAKEALPNAQHVSSTADLTASNDTAARAITGALTDHEIETLAHRMCWRYDHTGNYSGGPTYTFNSMTLQEFARKLMR